MLAVRSLEEVGCTEDDLYMEIKPPAAKMAATDKGARQLVSITSGNPSGEEKHANEVPLTIPFYLRDLSDSIEYGTTLMGSRLRIWR